MSGIWTKVKIINAFDELQIRRRDLSKNLIRGFETEATVDDTIIASVLPISVIDKLGLKIIQKEFNGNFEVAVSEIAVFEIFGRRSVEEAFVFGERIIIGRNALTRMDLRIDSKEQKLVPKHGDKPVFRI